MKLIDQSLYISLISGYLFFRCFEKVFEVERNENRKRKDRMMKFLALTLYLLARITLTLISSAAIIGYFRKVSFQGFDLII